MAGKFIFLSSIFLSTLTFLLLALALQAADLNARPNMQAPLLAQCVADFWGNRWNTAFNVLANRHGFRPLTPRIGPRAALVVVFIVTGLLHENEKEGSRSSAAYDTAASGWEMRTLIQGTGHWDNALHSPLCHARALIFEPEGTLTVPEALFAFSMRPPPACLGSSPSKA